MITMKELEAPVRQWVPDWLGLISIFIVILPVTMLNGSYTGSMLEVSNTLGTNSEDITMGYYAASAGMAIAYPIIPKVLAAFSVKSLLLIDLVLQFFFEVIIAPDYDVDALEILGQKKNRIILVRKEAKLPKKQFRSLLNGVLVQERDLDVETAADLKQVSEKAPTAAEVEDMLFANKIVKNSKSNAIVLAKNKQLLASGVGQTSRVDALKQAIEKAKSFEFDLHGAVMASDAFFPFPDCVEIADKEGVKAVIQPGGSVKDELTFQYCNEHGVAMVTTGIRHFKH